jgi:hypothetical protein
MSAETTGNPLRLGGQAALALGALGVVFGDIGTSPLYTLNETLGTLPPTERVDAILGALSLVFWSLAFAVCFKYLGFITRADNRGEGGIFALLALGHAEESEARRIGMFTMLIMFGAALLYGDGVITPAISVLGAAEGLTTLYPGIEPLVPTITALILAALFSVQHRGSRAIGTAFGPVMLAWFAAIGAFGLLHLVQTPSVLRALNPLLGLRLIAGHPGHATALLGSVTLAITGTEALYADMGHFGRRAIAWAWYGVAFPGLALSYFGQGAYALAHPDDRMNPFFRAGAGRPAALVAADSVDGGGRHCQPGADLGHVFADAAGDSTRLFSAAAGASHQSGTDGADLSADGECHAGGPEHRRRVRLRIRGALGDRVRHRGDRHDGDHDARVLSRRPATVALEPHEGMAAVRGVFWFSMSGSSPRTSTNSPTAAGCRLRWERHCWSSCTRGKLAGRKSANVSTAAASPSRS